METINPNNPEATICDACFIFCCFAFSQFGFWNTNSWRERCVTELFGVVLQSKVNELQLFLMQNGNYLLDYSCIQYENSNQLRGLSLTRVVL